MSPAEPSPVSTQSRNRRVRQVLLWTLLANWVVAAAKTAVGLWSGSASVTADGLHSFIDGASNILGLLALSIASRPADDDHPYGHAKFEALASLGIGAMIGVGSLELGKMAFSALISNRHPQVSGLMAAVMAVSLVFNLVISTVERRFGRRLQSPILEADARHTLSDVFVSGAVLASVALVYWGYPRADGIVALAVLVFVVYVAYGITRHAVGILSDTARLEPEAVALCVASIDGVRSSKQIRSRGLEESVYVDLIIEVDPKLPTADAHRLADRVEEEICQAFPQVKDVIVHVEPAL